MDKKYRIKAKIEKDQVLHVNMKQNVDLFEILSMNFRQDDAYAVQSANYGVVVGRVLANDAFGVPNAKVSVFIPLTDEDKLDTNISHLYPYKSVNSSNSDGIRYNLLPSYKVDDDYQAVGTFPSKRTVLDDDNALQVYDKYYRYTATTNKAGDYMIFGVPTGSAQIHIDVDLSDIGVLSQKPRDFIYKGYNINQFDGPTRFKSSSTLSSLPQIFSQDEAITVYPFWGDEDTSEIAITRKDINLQYDFETACVFLGCAITDTKNNDIGYDCTPNQDIGEMSQLGSSEGTIEMIRKTPFGNVEEKTIQGNQLIDSNGVWCYQIPMNLDYVGMDEYGNIVPTNDPTKGIATRTRVRFRISLNESGSDSLMNHRAKYLVPNNPTFRGQDYKAKIDISDGVDYDDYFQFGTNTPDSCYRDLLWNGVYTVKNFIPRLQKAKGATSGKYTGIKGVNKKAADGKNPFPYNNIRLTTTVTNFKAMEDALDRRDDYYKYNIGDSDSDYTKKKYVIDSAIYENDGVSLDFYNDWVNGVLYFPLWYWRVKKKKKYKKGQPVYDSTFCNCSTSSNGLCFGSTGDLPFSMDNGGMKVDISDYDPKASRINLKSLFTNRITCGNYDKINLKYRLSNGIIRQTVNKDGLNVYYYESTGINSNAAIRLFATDIVLLGSLSDNDINGIPQINDTFPISSANIPPAVARDGDFTTGMDWGVDYDGTKYKYKYTTGLFFGVDVRGGNRCLLYTMPKSFINAQRICEYGVTTDQWDDDDGYIADGLITKREIRDDNSRQKFATLNANPLIVSSDNTNPNTGYYGYLIDYTIPTDFDGKMNGFISGFTNGESVDAVSKDYDKFRFGSYGTMPDYKFFIKSDNDYFIPAYENSFYFYFGLNVGDTAMDVFRKNFYSMITSDSTALPFRLIIATTPAEATEAHKRAGSITLTVKGSSSRYEYSINDNDMLKLPNNNTITISGLSNGSYTVKIVDAESNSIERNVNLTFNPISVDYNMAPADSSQNVLGTLTLLSITLYGHTYPISNANVSFDGGDTADAYIHINNDRYVVKYDLYPLQADGTRGDAIPYVIGGTIGDDFTDQENKDRYSSGFSGSDYSASATSNSTYIKYTNLPSGNYELILTEVEPTGERQPTDNTMTEQLIIDDLAGDKDDESKNK